MQVEQIFFEQRKVMDKVSRLRITSGKQHSAARLCEFANSLEGPKHSAVAEAMPVHVWNPANIPADSLTTTTLNMSNTCIGQPPNK